jgi:hypothetical protein
MIKRIWVIMLLLSSLVNANIIYVDYSATLGLNNGESWENAFYSLKTGIDSATAGDTIVVAAGIYIPDSISRNISFYLKDSVKIFGGFAGDEVINSSTIESRNFLLNETILSGDIQGDDSLGGSNAENSYHIIFNNASNGNLTPEALLDGVTLQGANTLPGDNIHQQGAAIFNYANSASDTLKPTFRNIVIKNNTGYSIIYNWVYQGCITMNVENTRICNNNASQSVILLTINGTSTYPGTDSPHFINCNIVNNEGPAFFNTATSGYLTSVLAPKITNCIVWDNSRMMSFSSKTNRPLLVEYSIIQTGFDDSIDGDKMSDEGNNFVEDPMFVNQLSCSDTVYSISPAIDNGDNSYGWGNNIGLYQGAGVFTPLSVSDMTGILRQGCPGSSFDSIPIEFLAEEDSNVTLQPESDDSNIIDVGDITIYGTGSERYIDVDNSSKKSGTVKVYVKLTSKYDEKDSTYFVVEIFSRPTISNYEVTPTESGLALGQIDLTVTGGTGSLRYFADDIQHYSGNPITSLYEGDHKIYILDDNNCGSDTLTINVPLKTSSVDHSFSDNDLLVVPNPVFDVIKLKNQSFNNFSAIIFDVKGNIIQRTENEAEIDVSGIPEGVYFIKIQTEEFSKYKKVVILD